MDEDNRYEQEEEPAFKTTHELIEKKSNHPFSENELGMLTVSEEVVAIISSTAALEVPGVYSMSGGIAGEIVEMLGRKSLTKGVKVETGSREAAIDLYVIISYGYRVPEVAWDVQERVKEQVERMTSLEVVEVNVHVAAVHFESDTKEEENV